MHNIARLMEKFGMGDSERVVSEFLKHLDKNKFNSQLCVLHSSGTKRGFDNKKEFKLTEDNCEALIKEKS